MSSTKEIKMRIKGVNDTQKITNAMYLISSTKMRRAKAGLDATRPFFDALETEIRRAFRTVTHYESPYFFDGTEDLQDAVAALLVVTADKGLAGAYNQNVLKRSVAIVNERPNTKVFVMGEYGRQYFLRNNLPFEKEFDYSLAEPTLDLAREITVDLLERFDRNEFQEILVVFTDFQNGLEGETRADRILPFERRKYESTPDEYDEDSRKEFLFLPSVETILNNIVEPYFVGFVYGALVDSYCAEQNARMNAMSNANNNAEELLAELSVEYNRVRQSAITQEITEVSAGAKAQRRKRKKRSNYA